MQNIEEAARGLSAARSDMTTFGKLVQEVRDSQDTQCFTENEINLIEDEYARKAEVEKSNVAIFRSCMDRASHDVEAMTANLGTRTRIVDKHRDTLSRHPDILEAVDKETERFTSLLRSLEDLLQTTAK